MGTATAVQAKPVPRPRAADSSLRLNESAIRGGTTGVASAVNSPVGVKCPRQRHTEISGQPYLGAFVSEQK